MNAPCSYATDCVHIIKLKVRPYYIYEKKPAFLVMSVNSYIYVHKINLYHHVLACSDKINITQTYLCTFL